MAHGPPSKQKTNNDIDNNDDDELPPPPDGGWGWVVVIASFLIHIISKYIFTFTYIQNKTLIILPNDLSQLHNDDKNIFLSFISNYIEYLIKI